MVNRDNPVPAGYQDHMDIVNVKVEEDFFVPLERETAQKYLQLRDFFAARGIRIAMLSGYRFQSTQERIWRENVAKHGEAHAGSYVAQPGFSEHQTGLALDLSVYDDQGVRVEDTDIEAYAQLFPHLHTFGFILRYPAGKEDITGYPFEPWHIRYVGEEAAGVIYENGWTLEEFLAQGAAC